MSSSSSESTKLAMAKTALSTIASLAAAAMVIRNFAQDFIPYQFQDYLFFNLHNLFSRFSSQVTMVINEFDGLINNQIYEAAEIYLGTKISPKTRRLKVSKPEKENAINITMEGNEEVTDLFNSNKFKWVLVCKQVESKDHFNPRDNNATIRSEVRSFRLTFHKKHKQSVVDNYLPHVLRNAKIVKEQNKTLKIFTVDFENMYSMLPGLWTPVRLDHPATFETLSMDTKLKADVLADLERFVRRREYYKKVGKAWKRGYLLHGPPGTGKSSLIAAMANYLNFDVYDLELTELRGNSELRRLLLATANRSILVVEDIDCTIELQDRLAKARASRPRRFDHQQEQRITLSGLLNFVDGLWSSCGDERIIIFTTNHIEKLDPALLRPGRMDLHVHMSYCNPDGFRLLAANYLKIKDHELFGEIEELIRSTEVTPAEVAEQLLKSDDVDATLGGLIDFLHMKRKEKEEAEAKKEEPQSLEEERESEGEENQFPGILI